MAGMWHFILPIIAIGVAGFVIATSPRTARKVRRTGWFSIIINVAYLVLAGVLVATAVAQIQRAAG